MCLGAGFISNTGIAVNEILAPQLQFSKLPESTQNKALILGLDHKDVAPIPQAVVPQIGLFFVVVFMGMTLIFWVA